MTRLLTRQIVRWLPYAAWPPRVRRAVEREARDVLGMPWRHPDTLTRPLSRRREHQLEALTAELWPDSEWMQELLPWL